MSPTQFPTAISAVPSPSASIIHTNLSLSGSVTLISKVTFKGIKPSWGVTVNFSMEGGLLAEKVSTSIFVVLVTLFELSVTTSLALYKPSLL